MSVGGSTDNSQTHQFDTCERPNDRKTEQANYWPREPSVERSLERRIYMSQSMHRGSSWRIFLELEFLRDGR